MTTPLDTYFSKCLYFTANSLARTITRMAEEEFRKIGMSPSHAFLILLAVEHPGITQKELAEHLNLAPSTVSRFVDSLVHRGILEKKTSGKQARVFTTAHGTAQLDEIQSVWHGLYDRYRSILGDEESHAVTEATLHAFQKLSLDE